MSEGSENRFCPLEVKVQLYKCFWDKALYTKWHIMGSLHNPDLSVMGAPYKIRKECYLLRSCIFDARRMLLLMVDQVFLTMREVWSMQ